ncbi:MAG: carbon-nitrogen hydrolase family protein [Pseudomonadota bacterium]
MTELRILAYQISVPAIRSAAERDRHLEEVSRKIRSAAEPGQYDLIVLPELSSIEYSDAGFEALDQLEEPLAGPSYDTFSDLARHLKAAVVYGFPHRGPKGRHISQGVMGPDGGLIGRYDKLHIAGGTRTGETPHFVPGNHILVFEINGIRIAPLICYDLRFAPLADRLREAGVDLVLQCAAQSEEFAFQAWHEMILTRALETEMAWLGLNRAGDGWGRSIWMAGGRSMADAQTLDEGEQSWSLTLSVNALINARTGSNLGPQRRPDYAAIPIKEYKHGG